VQVVDRFHLVENLRGAVEAFLRNQRGALQAAAARTAQALTPLGSAVPVTPMYPGRRRRPPAQPHPTAGGRQLRHVPWAEIHATVHTLHAQGLPVATIARQLGISRPTVYAYLRRDAPPGPKRPQFRWSTHVLTPYIPYLIRRWRESGANSAQLWREIQGLGYTHSARTVGRFITQLRRASEAGLAPETQGSPYTRPQGPSARAVSFTLMCPDAKRSQDAQLYVEQLCQVEAGMARANELIQAFLTLVRERRGHDLEAWMAEAAASGIDELARFARGLEDDLVAITAGLTLEWSNGVTEGQIHRLKLVKRQGYGRAGFALLRQRVLHAA
jgi:transposase